MMNKYQLTNEEINILNKQLIEQYCSWYDIDFDYSITSEFQEKEYGNTVAMWLTSFNSLVPKQWIHDFNIKDKKGRTLKDLMIEKLMPIPYNWQNNEQMTIFDQAYFGVIPDIQGHKSDDQDDQGFTVAMILTYNNITIPKEWHHNPELQNKYGQTVAMIFLICNNDIPKEWQHDNNLKNIHGITITPYQINKRKIPPRKLFCDIDLQNDKKEYIKNRINENLFHTIMMILNQKSVQNWKIQNLLFILKNMNIIDKIKQFILIIILYM